MTIENFSQLTFIIHIIIAQGGSLFLIFFKSKGWLDIIQRSIVIFIIWMLMNIVFDGCPLTHFENIIAYQLYGQWLMPGYSFEDSWASEVLKIFR